MIKITIEQLVTAIAHEPGTGSGALGRLFACGLSISAWKANRKTAAACEGEFQSFQKKRDELIDRYGGQCVNENSLTFQDPEKAKAFADDWAALMAVEIEIPGEPLRMEDILTGQLRQTDAHVLRPFLVDD